MSQINKENISLLKWLLRVKESILISQLLFKIRKGDISII